MCKKTKQVDATLKLQGSKIYKQVITCGSKRRQYMSITANIVPNITGHLRRKTIKLVSQKEYPQLTQNLTMVDC
jgi:CTP synthase (UTP-ammonia lyase)